jgi:hypothetical protein
MTEVCGKLRAYKVTVRKRAVGKKKNKTKKKNIVQNSFHQQMHPLLNI